MSTSTPNSPNGNNNKDIIPKSPTSPNNILKLENGKFRINFTSKKTSEERSISLSDESTTINGDSFNSNNINSNNNNNNIENQENYNNEEYKSSNTTTTTTTTTDTLKNTEANGVSNKNNENSNNNNNNNIENSNINNNIEENNKPIIAEDNDSSKNKEILQTIQEVSEEKEKEAQVDTTTNNNIKTTTPPINTTTATTTTTSSTPIITETEKPPPKEQTNYFSYKNRYSNESERVNDLIETNKLVEEYVLKTPPLTRQLFQMDKNQIESFRIESMNKYLENYRNDISYGSNFGNSSSASAKRMTTSSPIATSPTQSQIRNGSGSGIGSGSSLNGSIARHLQPPQQQDDQSIQEEDDFYIIGEKDSVSMENLVHLDQPTYIPNDPPKEPFIVCQIWGCGQLFTQREFKNHLEVDHDTSNLNNNNGSIGSGSSSGIFNGVDIINISNLTDKITMDRYSKGSLPAVISGLPKNWNISNYNLQFLFQKLPFNNAMWSRLNFNTASIQWVGNVHKFQKTVNTPNRSFHENYCLKVSFDIPVSWEPLPYFGLNYYNVVQGNDQQFLKSYLFVGNQGSIVSLHRNFCDVSISMFKGSQRVILFPPNKILEMAAYNRYLLNHHKDRTKYIYFDYYLSQEDIEIISRFGGKCVILNKEETIYIPAGWYYQINVLEDESISLNYQNLTIYNLEFYIQNFKQSNEIILSDLFKGILLDYFSRCSYWITNQSQYIVKANQSILLVQDKEQKNWNGYGIECKNQSVYQQILSALQEGFILSSSTLLINNSATGKKQLQEQLQLAQQKQYKPQISVNQNYYHPYGTSSLSRSNNPTTTTSTSTAKIASVIDQLNIIDSQFCDSLKKITHDLNFILISISSR